MKIAIANRDRNTYPGGDLIQIDALGREINKIPGYYTDWPLGFRPNFEGYDVVHAYHLNFQWSNIVYTNIWTQNKPYFITSIFFPTDQLGSSADEMREYVNRSLFTVIQSNREKQDLLDIVKCDESKLRIIPNGVEQEFVSYTDKYIRRGVITVSARSGDKNTHLVEQACDELEIPYTNITNTPRQNMPQIYQSAKVFVSASTSECMSLCTHEALASMCRVVDTKFNRGNEWYPILITCDPNDYEDLKNKIRIAYFSDFWPYTPNMVAQQMTWANAAREYIKCLQESL